jgi:hypothetical protein
MMPGAHLFGLSSVLEAGWSQQLQLRQVAALSVMCCGEAFHRLGVQGGRRSDSDWCFISTKCGSNVSGWFWNQSSHSLLP